eukprot:15218339-Alexandrium_andersonii.AAC.2
MFGTSEPSSKAKAQSWTSELVGQTIPAPFSHSEVRRVALVTVRTVRRTFDTSDSLEPAPSWQQPLFAQLPSLFRPS